MAVKSRPRAVSRVSVTVVLLDSMSTSPDCSAVKRCCEVSGTYLTFSASPKIAAATARQTSTDRPRHLPWLSAIMKPAVPRPTPQISEPRALTASRSLPAMAPVDRKIAAKPAAAAASALRIEAPLSFYLAGVSAVPRMHATGQMQAAQQLLGPSCSSPPLGGEARRGGNDVRNPLSRPLPLAGERSMKEGAGV